MTNNKLFRKLFLITLLTIAYSYAVTKANVQSQDQSNVINIFYLIDEIVETRQAYVQFLKSKSEFHNNLFAPIKTFEQFDQLYSLGTELEQSIFLEIDDYALTSALLYIEDETFNNENEKLIISEEFRIKILQLIRKEIDNAETIKQLCSILEESSSDSDSDSDSDNDLEIE